jgi:hypothetical protein
MPLSLRLLQKNNLPQFNFLLKPFSYLIYALLFLMIAGCAASKKFTRDEKNADDIYKDNSSIIRVLLDEKMNSFSYTVDESIILKNELKTISHVDKGNILLFYPDGNNVKLLWDDNSYSSKFFQVLPENERTLKVSDKSYKGAFRIASQNNKIQIINTLTL